MTEHALKIENPSWWRRRPRTEKCLVIAVALLTLLIIILLLSFLLGLFKRECKYGSGDVCFTPDCVKTAAQVLEKVDLDVNPCEDFYKFACGNFIKNTRIPEDKQMVNSFTVVSDKVSEQMENLLKEPITKNDIKPFVLAKSLYQACMNTTEIEANSLPNLQKLIKNTGGWHLIEENEWNRTDFDWIETEYKLMRIGFSSIFLNFEVLTDISNSSKNALFLDQQNIYLDKIMRIGFNDSDFLEYYKYMVKIVTALGAEEEKAREEMREVANFITTLARITVPQEDRRNSSLENNPMTVKELENKFTYVPWLTYINFMLHPYKKLAYDDIIIVKIPSYYEKLQDVLNNTSKRVIANYMYWSIVEGSIDYLNEDLTNIKLQFKKAITGVIKLPPRWKTCTQEVIRLYVASGALYVRNFFKNDSKATLIEMIDYLEQELVKTILTVEWMDTVTKRHAIKKVKAMYRHVGYPDELLDDKKLENYYKNLTFSPLDYLGSKLNLSLFKNHIEYPTLNKAIDKKNWENHAYVALVSAFYDNTKNSIEFLAALLQDAFFDVNRPKYMNYGSIGHFIGHEMTHGLDDQGRQYDEDGNLADWWKSETEKSFIAKAQCIIDQYGNISVPEIDKNINGKLTQGENIADNAGIKLAYLAYKEWSKKHGVEPMLPGLPYTPEQMFWISVANIWCIVETNKLLKISLMNDAHVPHRYRVNVPMMNSEYFIKDFNCPLNSKMNPEHKCSVW